MTLKVIGAGFGRTGTASMKEALEQLGYHKTHHMFEVMPNKQQQQYWHDIGHGKPVDWDAVFEGYEAAVDFPSASYYAEMLEHFPDAKVVLTVRDVDRWYKSARETIYEIGISFPTWARKLIPPIRRNREMVVATVWDRVFDGRFEDEAYAKQVFRDYVEQVKATVPADKLLVFEVKEGWEPLCAFLGDDVPDTPFPHVNDSAQFKKTIRTVKWVFAGIHLLAIALLAALIWWLFFSGS